MCEIVQEDLFMRIDGVDISYAIAIITDYIVSPLPSVLRRTRNSPLLPTCSQAPNLPYSFECPGFSQQTMCTEKLLCDKGHACST